MERARECVCGVSTAGDSSIGDSGLPLMKSQLAMEEEMLAASLEGCCWGGFRGLS